MVPPLNFMMEKALSRLLGKPPMVVGPGVRTGLNIRLAVQSQVGADIVADAVAALEKFEPPIVTIDMGTATTIGVISAVSYTHLDVYKRQELKPLQDWQERKK